MEQKHAIIYQLDLFEKETPISAINRRIDTLAESMSKVRRGIFARINDLGKLYLSYSMRLDAKDIEIAQLKSRIERLEEFLYESQKDKRICISK